MGYYLPPWLWAVLLTVHAPYAIYLIARRALSTQ